MAMDSSSPRLFKLLAVAGDGPALLDLQAAQGHADAAGAIGQRVGFAAGLAVIDRLGAAQLDNAAMPECGVLPLGSGQVAQHLSAHRVRVAVGQSQIGVVALHLCRPIAFQRRQNLLQPRRSTFHWPFFMLPRCLLENTLLISFVST